jgi:hypothetical protein
MPGCGVDELCFNISTRGSLSSFRAATPKQQQQQLWHAHPWQNSRLRL